MFLSENADSLKEKWAPVLEHADLPAIEDSTRRDITTRLLENQQDALQEDAVVAGGMQNWDPILISLVRRSVPQMLAYDTIGVQPMNGPTGLIFYMKSYYTNAAGTEQFAPGVKPNTTFSGPTVTADAEALGGFVTGGAAFAEMTFGIEKTSVDVKSRALKAKYSMELAQDLKAVHGLDAEAELASILSNEILQEINWEVIDEIGTAAKPGAQNATLAGTFDLTDVSDNEGARWGGERYKSLITQINKEANLIAKQTGRGAGNFLIVSADIASVLDMTAGLSAPTMSASISTGMQTDITQGLMAGILGGKYKVFVDPYAATNTVTVGYKGSSEMDAGIFYCPYVPLQMMKSQGEEDFQPRIGFKTRYGMKANPFAGGAGANQYYRKFTVAGI